MRRSTVLAVVLLHAAAWAQAPEREPPKFRVSLSGGGAWRTSDRREPNQPGLHYQGFAPPVLHLAGAVFFLPWLGLALDASYETFAVQREGTDRAQARLHGARFLGEAVARWSPVHFIGLELHVGYGGGFWPMLGVDTQTTPITVQSRAVDWHGPHVGFAVALEPDGPVGGQLFGRLGVAFGGQTVIRPLVASAGFQLFFGNLTVGNLHGSVLLEGEVIGVRGGVDTSGLENNFNQLQLRGLLGLRVRYQEPEPPPPPPVTTGKPDDGATPPPQPVKPPPTGPGRIKGIVRGDKDAPLEGAEVALEGKKPVKTAADGSYTLESAGPGVTKVTVKAKGYKDGDDAAQVPPEAVATLDFTLVKQGEKQLATIRGFVKAASGRSVRATVRVSDVNKTIPIKGDGRFVVQVPGGKYTLTIEAAGYVTQVKTVEVADGDQAIFHCDLQPAGR
ncbi:MAG: carboxypeptidase regulatory-like domain-containing protein [Myxococcaceae bacterium]|nr:carboxypeptidase regulatory-like domain-containing protein [Myxococcaceae bacterium]